MKSNNSARRTSRSVRRRSGRLTAIDLFAGCGGLTSGLQNAGFTVLAAVENNADAAKTYRANHREVALHEGDIVDLSARSLIQSLKLPKGARVDLLAGCPPCQGFTRLTESR